MVVSLKHQALAAVTVHHPAVDRLNLTWNDLRICFELRKMNTQLFQKYFNHIRYWKWPWISEHVELDESFIYLYCRHVDWAKISRHQRLTVDLVAHFETDISWVDLSANPHLTIDILTQFATRLDWGLVCKTIVLTEDQIIQFLEYIDWYEVSLKSPLGEPFIERYRDRVHWPRITAHQVLTDRFIDNYADRVDWDYISRHRPMKLEYIERHAAHVDWGLISDGQTLTEQFILDHRDRLDWEEIAFGQPISEAFFEEHAPKTSDIWAAFTAGRRLTSAFIARNIAHLPARELTRYQTFTLAELDTYADHLDWHHLSVVHTFTQPGQTEMDGEFIRRHARRFDWPHLVRTHVLPTDLLMDFFIHFNAIDIQQDVPLDILRRHPEMVNRKWISHNCPLTVEYLRAAAQMIDWDVIITRHLPEDVVRTFTADLNLSLIPVYQPPMSPEWIAEQAHTARQWALVEELDPRYWPLYASPPNLLRYSAPADEFVRRNKDLLFPDLDLFFDVSGKNILLITLVSLKHLGRPFLINNLRTACALNELNVPSSWDYIERLHIWPYFVRMLRLSESFLRRFQHRVAMDLVSKCQNRPFSQQFVRDFHKRLDFSHLQLPYDVTRGYLRKFGTRHNWAQLTPNLQEWQMEQYLPFCNFKLPPNKNLSELFIKAHYSFEAVAATQPLSEKFIRQYITKSLYEPLSLNTKLTLSQRFIQHYQRVMPAAHWARVSNQTLSMPPMPLSFAASNVPHAELSAYSRFKLERRAKVLNTHAPPDIAQYNTPQFWTEFKLSEAMIRRLIQTVDWSTLLMHQKLTSPFLDEFLTEYADRVDWRVVSEHQVLPEATIRQFKDYVHWPIVCRHQKLSEAFIAEFADRVSWEPLSPFSACWC